MHLTNYHTKYFAYELTKRCPPDSIEKLAGTVASAQVDLIPHQVDAALFAFSSPLSRGALLADEVGLGKTIEAGLVISQKWAERKRRILIITPSNLRKQWHQEPVAHRSAMSLIQYYSGVARNRFSQNCTNQISDYITGGEAGIRTLDTQRV